MAWVFLPLCRCSLDAAGSTLEPISAEDSELSPIAKPSHTGKPASCPRCGGADWIRPRWMTTLEPLTQEALGDALMSWQAAIRASRTVSQENARGSRTSAGSGHTSVESSKSADQGSSCARTSPELFPPEDLLPSWKTWKDWATKRPHTKFPLLRLELGTFASASSLLPTLTRPNGGRKPKGGTMSRTGMTPDGKKRQVDLTFALNLQPTLTKHGNYNRKGASKNSGDGLATAIKLMPTLQKHDAGKGQGKRWRRYGTKHGASNLNDFVAAGLMPTLLKRDARTARGGTRSKNAQGGEPLVVQIGGTLNPEWAEWYMGVPIGWTELEPWATSWFHSKRCPPGAR